ncbi:MAG: LysM peptidoglycan-binding domain-containing protein [Microbacterium sp.]
MSSIAISSRGFHGVSGRTRLRITRRGRRVLSAVVATPIALGIVFGGIAGGTALASGSHAAPVAFETVVVMPGDTLWSIAEEAAPGADPRDVVAEISRLNNLQNGALAAGQELAIPVAYSQN